MLNVLKQESIALFNPKFDKSIFSGEKCNVSWSYNILNFKLQNNGEQK